MRFDTSSTRCRVVAGAVFLVLASVSGASVVEPAHVVFVHPDGASLNAWNAARAYWVGPDSVLAWDRMPEMAVYRGPMADQIGATSNGGATTHAFGVRVRGEGSFGRDGSHNNARAIRAADGFDGSVLREAALAGHPVGLVNDGDLPEPGTGCFFAEADHRDLADEIARQFVDGRPGHEHEDVRPVVALGGGEAFFLPQGTRPCGETLDPDCVAHVDPIDGTTARRTDGRNLVRELLDDGWVVLRTRAEFDAAAARLAREPDWTPRVLGLFAAADIFNDTREEVLIDRGLVRDAPPADDPRAGRLVDCGTAAPGHGFDPPRAEEMHAFALEVLRRHSERAGRPFLLVTEIESVDNMGNSNNAMGTLLALRSSDRVIAETLDFVAREPRTLVFTAADSDASGLQVVEPLESLSVNPTGRAEDEQRVEPDGVMGRGTAPFVAAPDAAGTAFEFYVAWTGTKDFAGAILSRFAGHRAEEIGRRFSTGFGNDHVYHVIRCVLFGEDLP